MFSELRIELNLPILIVNSLHEARINTVKKLTSKTPEELLKLPHFSKEFLNKVKKSLARKNLTLNNTVSKVKPENRSLSLIGNSTPISSLNLPNSVRNALLSNKIKTIGQLIFRTEQELLHIPRFGKTALIKVKGALAEKNLSLKNPSSDLSSILSLDISNKTKNIFLNRNINNIEELISKTEQELMRIPNFGKKALAELKQALTKRNLSLSKTRSNSDSISSLEISSYFVKILQLEGIKTIEELADKTEQELMKLSHFPKRFLWEIKTALAKKGYYLKQPVLDEIVGSEM